MHYRNHRGCSRCTWQANWAEGKIVFSFDWKIILSTVVAPAIAILVPLCVRAAKQAPQLTATDIFAFLFVLDVAVVTDKDKFDVLLHGELKDSLPALASISIIICVVFWMVCQLVFDENILKYHERRVIRNAILAHNQDLNEEDHVAFALDDEGQWAFLWLSIQWLIAWGVCLALIVSHIKVLSGGRYPWH